MYLTHNKIQDYWIVDIEADGLLDTVSQIWVAVVKNCGTGEVKEFYDATTFNEWYSGQGSEVVLVGHNILQYDIPVLNRLWGCRIPLESRCVDTIVLSSLYNAAIEGGHGLEAWGVRLRYPKGNHSDWSRLTPEMVVYCRQDVELTHKLFTQLTAKMKSLGFSELSCEIEHKTKVIIEEQQQNGFYFDEARGREFRDFLLREQSDLSEKIQRLFPPRRTKVAEYTFRRRKDGSPPAQYEKHRDKYNDVVFYESSPKDSEHKGLPYYECFDFVHFNIGSPNQRVERFLELGWEPTEFTEAGNPKVNEDEILKFAESTGGSSGEALVALASWLVVSARLSMLAGNPKTKSVGWLGHVVDHGDGDTRIHGKVMACGAASRRMTHNTPNTANVPSPHKAKYGHEMRGLWGVQPGKGLIEVGVDASGLENVGLLHYLSDKYRGPAAELLNQKKPNDVHSLNSRRLTEALGYEVDREWGAKTSYYAAMYGAYPKKLGQIVKGTTEDGQIVQDILLNSVPGLKELTDECQSEWRARGGRIRCIDGGFVVCPVMSAALNYRIQSLGAIVMKLAAILLKEEAREAKLWFRLLGWIHDEWQMECREDDGEKLGQMAVSCITRAAVILGFKVPLTGAYILGKNWSECH